jgi:hypothetical protein
MLYGGRNRYLFSDKYIIHKIECGHSVQLLNDKPAGASRNQ